MENEIQSEQNIANCYQLPSSVLRTKKRGYHPFVPKKILLLEEGYPNRRAWYSNSYQQQQASIQLHEDLKQHIKLPFMKMQRCAQLLDIYQRLERCSLNMLRHSAWVLLLFYNLFRV